jgi:serine protease inhibitor
LDEIIPLSDLHQRGARTLERLHRQGFEVVPAIVRLCTQSPMNPRFKSSARFVAILLCASIGCLSVALSDGGQSAPSPTLTLTTRLNDFGFRLLGTLASGSTDNVIISPYSVSLALAMTYNGAAGDTKAAMAKTLALSGVRDEQLNRSSLQMIEAVEKADPSVQMGCANALWAKSGFPINPGFLKVTHDFYNALVESVDFSTNPDGAADTINAWVSQSTYGKIPTIIKSPGRLTRLVLIDAVYFKGRWQNPFDKSATQPRPFHLQGQHIDEIQVPMMVQSGKYQYLETDTFQAIALPYGNWRFQMYVVLPRGKCTLADLMGSLDESHWRDWTAKFSSREGKIVLPKFGMTYARKLNDALSAMGMAVAFDWGKADFSLIHQPPPNIYLTDVEHKTYLKVDEEGTEAAAGTAVGVSADYVRANPPPPFEMVVDHPFFFAIGEQQTQALLFAGVITNPSSN